MKTKQPPIEKTGASARILGKRIRLEKDYDPAGKDADTVIRTAIPFSTKAISDDDRTIEFIGSTATHDRYGDVIEQTGWELGNFVKNPVIPWGHDYGSPPVAKAVEVGLREGNLFFKGQFATAEEYEFADTIYKLYKGGYLRAFSVGFIPLEWKIEKEYDEDGQLVDLYWVFTKCELLEVSCVTVPANPEALVLAFRDGTITDHERGVMVKQAEKLISSLTSADKSEINEGMNDETKAYIDTKFEELTETIKSLAKTEEPAPQPETDEPADNPSEDAPDDANPSEDPDGGTPEEVTEDQVRSAVRDGFKKQLGIIE